MRKLADHIRQAHEDAERVHISSQKITQRFARIEAVELEHPEIGAGEGVAPVPAVVAVAVPELPLLAPAGPAPGAG